MWFNFSWSIPLKGMVVLFSFLQVVATSTKAAGYSRLETNIGELVIASTNLSDGVLPVTYTGLANGTPYRFAIPAVNVVGVSPASESPPTPPQRAEHNDEFQRGPNWEQTAKSR